MLFAVDIGNSSVSFGVFDAKGTLLLKSKVDAVKSKSADEYAVLFQSILRLRGFDGARMTESISCPDTAGMPG